MSRLMEVSQKIDHLFLVSSVCLLKIYFSLYLQSQVVRFEVWDVFLKCWWRDGDHIRHCIRGFWFEPSLFHHLISFDKKNIFLDSPHPNTQTHAQDFNFVLKWRHTGGQCCYGLAFHPGRGGRVVGGVVIFNSMVLHGASIQDKLSLCRLSHLF